MNRVVSSFLKLKISFELKEPRQPRSLEKGERSTFISFFIHILIGPLDQLWIPRREVVSTIGHLCTRLLKTTGEPPSASFFLPFLGENNTPRENGNDPGGHRPKSPSIPMTNIPSLTVLVRYRLFSLINLTDYPTLITSCSSVPIGP